MRSYAGKTLPTPSVGKTTGRLSFLARRDGTQVAEPAFEDAERAAPARAPFDWSRIPIHPPSMSRRLSAGPPGGDVPRGRPFFHRIGLAGGPALLSLSPMAKGEIAGAATISSPGDPHEREADEVAEKVMRIAEPARIGPASVAIQRACAACEDDERKTIHEKRAPSTGAGAGLDTAAAVRAAEHGGEALPKATRDFFEPFFGHDLGPVRVHASAEATRGARAVQARAYTIGHDIVFGHGEYAPDTAAGRRLLAHELTHVMQQRAVPSGSASELQRQPSGGPAPSGGGSSGCGSDFKHEFAGEINEELPEAHRGVPRMYYASPPQGDNPGNPVEELVTGTPVDVGQKGGYGGLWRAVCAQTSKMPTQILWVMGAYISNLEDCVTEFKVTRDRVEQNVTAGPGGTTQIKGHHLVEVSFADRCGCADLEYRQFIAGVAVVTRSGSGTTEDLTDRFPYLPGGRLPPVMTEDGKRCAAKNYGHRDQPGNVSTGDYCPEDRYINDAGQTDQTNGCRYRSEDFPKLTVTGMQSKDLVDLEVSFRGEVRQKGRVIKTEEWTDINTKVRTP